MNFVTLGIVLILTLLILVCVCDQKYKHYLVVVAIAIAVGLLVHLLCSYSNPTTPQRENFETSEQTFGSNGKSKPSLPRTSFREIDDQHAGMANALDHFHDLCVEHWQTEQSLFDQGKMKTPPGHHNVNTLWKEHNAQHKSFIGRIKQMKKDLVKHIKVYDVPQFHFAEYL